jgi:hypothetical protein
LAGQSRYVGHRGQGGGERGGRQQEDLAAKILADAVADVAGAGAEPVEITNTVAKEALMPLTMLRREFAPVFRGTKARHRGQAHSSATVHTRHPGHGGIPGASRAGYWPPDR